MELIQHLTPRQLQPRAVLIHRGTRPEQTGPLPTVGTGDPSIWLHIVVTTGGSIYVARLKSEHIDREPTQSETLAHFRQHVRTHHSPWLAVCSPEYGQAIAQN